MTSTDDAAFAEFVSARWSALYRTAYLVSGNAHEAEDLVQAALANTYARWSRIRQREAVEAYVRRAIINGAARGWRNRARDRATDTVPDLGHDGGLGAHGDHDALWQAVCTLPPRMRAALVLRYYEDLSEAETAAALDCSVGAVKSQTHHALRRLRAALGETRTSFLEGIR